MNTSVSKLTIYVILVLFLFSANSLLANAHEYQKFHQDIQVAFADEDIKKAKTIVKELLPILGEDIEYTKMVISEEEDEYFLEQLSSKYKRQKEIKQSLEAFLKTKKVDEGLSKKSMNMVRELRRLTSKPRER